MNKHQIIHQAFEPNKNHFGELDKKTYDFHHANIHFILANNFGLMITDDNEITVLSVDDHNVFPTDFKKRPYYNYGILNYAWVIFTAMQAYKDNSETMNALEPFISFISRYVDYDLFKPFLNKFYSPEEIITYQDYSFLTEYYDNIRTNRRIFSRIFSKYPFLKR